MIVHGDPRMQIWAACERIDVAQAFFNIIFVD